LTGDSEGDDLSILKNNDIIVTTPEKWDSVSRKLKDHSRLAEITRLLLVLRFFLERRLTISD
jgi:ATP-dependent DNA helicase HFM1/MER3